MTAFPKTVEDQLSLARKGRKAELSLKFGDLEIPCRILGHEEEADTIASAKLKAKAAKPEPAQAPLFESMEVMKAILMKATNLKNVQFLTPRFLKEFSSSELDSLYDQYLTLMNEVNPEFENISPEKIGEMIAAVKKKEKGPKDFFTWQLAAIGRLFLQETEKQAAGEAAQRVSAPGR